MVPRADVLATNIVSTLSDEFSAVARPDHPLLFDPPDLLVAAPGNLVAGFVLKSTERRSADDLFVRLAVARLGLPPNLRCVLLVPHTAREAEPPPEAHFHFHDVFSTGDLRGIRAFVRDRGASGRADEIPQGLREHAFRVFEVLLDETQKKAETSSIFEKPDGLPESIDDRASSPRGKPAMEVVQDLRRSREYRPTRIRRWSLRDDRLSLRTPRNSSFVRWERGVVAALPGGDRRGLSGRLALVCRDIIQNRFVLDNGVPYPAQVAESLMHPPSLGAANVLVVDEIPFSRFDPDKPIRAAAFAGWAMSTAEGWEEVERDAEFLREKLSKVENERQ